VLLVIACVLLGVAAGGIAYVAMLLRDGVLDARPEHARGMEPILVHAADEPFWFYGFVTAMAVLSILLLVVGWKMLRQAWHPR
jgi:hypothetical protein